MDFEKKLSFFFKFQISKSLIYGHACLSSDNPDQELFKKFKIIFQSSKINA